MMQSENAMRAAKRVTELIEIRGAEQVSTLITADEIAQIFDEEMTSNWIPCAERMPTEKDADRWGHVLWGVVLGQSPIPCHTIIASWVEYRSDDYSHWQTLPASPEKENAQN